MGKVRPLPLARIALQVSKAVLPRYRKPFQQTPLQPTAVAGHSPFDARR
jgi:hypothetical protein